MVEYCRRVDVHLIEFDEDGNAWGDFKYSDNSREEHRSKGLIHNELRSVLERCQLAHLDHSLRGIMVSWWDIMGEEQEPGTELRDDETMHMFNLIISFSPEWGIHEPIIVPSELG